MNPASKDIRIRPGTVEDIETIHAAILRLGAHIGAPEEITSTA
ncbi:MAG: GNAT family N-acetyltransferase, partial [Mesorhizobium sp.]